MLQVRSFEVSSLDVDVVKPYSFRGAGATTLRSEATAKQAC
jgi:hypothetical protein